MIQNLLLQRQSVMQHSPQEIYDIDQEITTLLSTKMQRLGQPPIRSVCLSELQIKHETKHNVSPKTNKATQSESNDDLLSITLYSPEAPSLAKSKRTKKIEQKNNLKPSIKEKLKLFEIHKQSQGMRRPHIREVSIKRLNQFSGQGCLMLPTNKKYEGEWIDGSMVGQAKIFYPNGDVYTGEVYGYQRHGKGQLTFSQGKYVGEFSGQDFHGFGTLFNKEGQITYEGLWRRGKKYEK